MISEINKHEVQNAFNQASREFNQRFDFRNTGVEIKQTDNGFYLSSKSEERIKAAYEVLCDKFLKRKLSLKFLDPKKEKITGKQTWEKEVKLKDGIDKENSKIIINFIKSNKDIKVTTTIKDKIVRVNSKKKDELQKIISIIEKKSFAIKISFNNFRN